MNEIRLTGSVGASFWDEECFAASDVQEQLTGLKGPLTVRINSGGGVATEGQAIYTALKNYPDDVTVVIDGIAASAASLIAMAGDHIIMPLGSILMIHDPAQWCVEGRGTEDDHLSAAKSLRVIANAYAAIYAARAGITVAEAREIMREETYYDGASAVEAGFATQADDVTTAAAAALFDYRIYSKAPKSLLDVGGALSSRRSRRAVMAALGNTGKLKGNQMPKHRMTEDEKTRELEEQIAAEELEEELAEVEIDPETGEPIDPEITAEELDEDVEIDPVTGLPVDENITAEVLDDENKDSEAIARLCRLRGVAPQMAARYSKTGLTLMQVAALHPRKGTKMTIPRKGLPRAQILRDERETRRAAAAEAIHAQLTRKGNVSGAARPFMSMGIVEIAAAVSGQRRPQMRSFGDRQQVLMDASHATSDFPAIFQNALNKTLLERYSEFEPTFKQIAKQRNFKDFRPMPLVRSGDFPTLQPVPETGEIKWGTFGESGEVAVIAPYARGLTISRQMMINDDLGAIQDMLDSYGETVAYFEEQKFYSLALGAVMSDGKTIFHTDHGNLLTAAALDVDGIAAGRKLMRKQKSIDGQNLNLSPSILLVGPEQETAAEMVIAAITPSSRDDVNPFAGKLTPVVSAEIIGKDWYLLSSRAPAWTYGYLEGAEGPRLRTEEPFGTQGFSMTVELDIGFGAADHRGAVRNPGL